MAINRNRIENRLRPFLLTRLPGGVLDLLVTEDYIDLYNDVANDLNNVAVLNVERYYKTASTTTAEDASITNFLLAGIIEKVLWFRYEQSGWEDQRYSFANDRIILKSTGNGAVLDIHYLRKPEQVSIGTDEIDLPGQIEQDYYDLLKVRFLSEYGENANVSYSEALEYYAEKARRKVKVPKLENMGVQRFWMHQSGDDTIYDITEQYIDLENFVTGVDGNYTYNGANNG